MAESKLTIEERHTGDVTVLVLTGQMLLDDGDLAFGKQISDLIEQGRAKIVLDLGGLTYIDSSGIGMIVFQQKALRKSGGDMKLLHLNRRAETLFGMLKLLIVFERFEDEAAAVQSFAWAAGRNRGTDRPPQG
jgi:anti-sigma B factor antagonist